MAIDVLHDILNRPFSGAAQPPRREPNQKPNSNADPNPAPEPKAARKPAAPRPEGKKQRERPTKPSKSGGRGSRVAPAPTGQVAILKRTEPLKAPGNNADDDSRKPEKVYAGSGFSNSPAPSSLPLPSFSTKKEVEAAVDQLATIGLRRMLRLA